MVSKLLNFIGFQAGWFACILGAAAGRPWIGPAVVSVLAAANVLARRNRAAELRLLALAGVLGYAVDSVLVAGGVLRFAPEAQIGWPSTVWMVAMWVNLATTLTASLGWMRGRYAVGAIFGAIGGPLAYLAGAALGAVTFGAPLPVSLAAVGLAWAVSMPVLLRIGAAAKPSAPPAATSIPAGVEGRP